MAQTDLFTAKTSNGDSAEGTIAINFRVLNIFGTFSGSEDLDLQVEVRSGVWKSIANFQGLTTKELALDVGAVIKLTLSGAAATTSIDATLGPA